MLAKIGTMEKPSKVKIGTIVAISLFFIGVIIILGYFIDLSVHRDKSVSGNAECTIIPQADTYTVVKQPFSQWHWTYKKNNLKVEQNCPSVNHDANVLYDGAYVGGTDAKILSLVSKTLLRDCHGKTMFVLRTGDAFGTIVNGNNILVNYEVRDLNDTVIAYSTGTHFITDEIKLSSITGNTIADMRRNKLSFDWTWTIEVFDQDHAYCQESGYSVGNCGITIIRRGPQQYGHMQYFLLDRILGFDWGRYFCGHQCDRPHVHVLDRDCWVVQTRAT